MDVDIPICAEDERPDGIPFYSSRYCDCGTEYELVDIEDEWRDEFHCPNCDDGILIDTPDTWVHQLLVAIGEEQRRS